jgi:hypothetical protein
MLLTVVFSGCKEIDSVEMSFNINDEYKPVVNGVTVKPGTAALGKGVSQQFNAEVSGNKNGAVIWSVEESRDPATVVSETGLLQVGANETAKTIKVKANARSDSNKWGLASVMIIGNQVLPVENGITVRPSEIIVIKGSRQPFTASLSATGEPAGSVTWTVQGSISEGNEASSISDDGVLTVSTREAAEALTVRADYDGKYGTAILYIRDNGGSPPDDGILYPSNLLLSVSPIELTMDKGATSEPFTAMDSSGNDVTNDVEWSLHKAVGSGINGRAVTIGTEETAECIGVKAVNPETGDSGEAVVRVRGNESEPTIINNGVQIWPQPATVAPGGEKVFTATDSINGGTPVVTWRVQGGKDGTTVNSGGKLSLAANETAAWLTLRAEMAGGRYGTAAVKVEAEEDPPTGTNVHVRNNGVIVNPATITLARGSSAISFTALDDEDAALEVDWSLEDDWSLTPGTEIDTEGKLYIAAGENLPVITIKAVNKADSGKYGTAIVYVNDTGEGEHPLTAQGITVEPGTWELIPDGTKLFTAKLTGTEDSVSVTWGLDPSERKTGTAINKKGLLSIASDEVEDTVLVVRAVGSDGKYGTARVTVSAVPVSVSEVTVKFNASSVSELTAERGESRTFTAEVKGENLSEADQQVSWSIDETGKDDETTISEAGILSIAATEPHSELTVRATSKKDQSKSCTVTINIPTVSVSITPTSVGVQKGGATTTFTAKVTALHGADNRITWSIVEPGVTASSISDSGVLTVGEDESLNSLTVKVTSTFNKPTKWVTASVTLSAAPPVVSNVTITSPADDPLYIGRGVANTQFSASVQGSGSPSQTVTWSIVESGKHQNTSIGSDGKLTIAAAEPLESLTVRATASGTSIYGEKTVFIPTVRSVSITTAPEKVVRGNTAGSNVGAFVNAVNNASTAVTWSITSAGIGSGTKIAGDKLYVDADETVTNLTIKATSDVDASKYATADVAVSTVTAVTVSVATVSRGSNTTLNAEVQGANNPSQELTWQIVSTGHTSGTSINETNGYLTVALTEAKNSITVRATSVEDSRKHGEGSVQIPTVTSVSVSPATADVPKGGNLQFQVNVSASGGAATTVTWSIVTSNVKAGTKFSTISPGLLQVASDETTTPITIQATSTVDTSKYGTATVTVPQPTVTGVTLSPSDTVIVGRGCEQQFSATVAGTDSPSQTVTWSIEATHHNGTSISDTGKLFVDAAETAAKFTVMATSTADTSMRGKTMVLISDVVDAANPSIKAKFGIMTSQVKGVEDTFNALHTFIQNGGLTSFPDVIKVDNYIDLEGGLTVDAYGTASSGSTNSLGGFRIVPGTEAGQASQSITTVSSAEYNPNYSGVLLRLVVVGINSFKGKNGNTTNHVVFQFQNIPVKRRLNPTNSNAGGYAASEIREYLTPVTGKSDSGRFLVGLIAAGVPDAVLWAPKRIMAKEWNSKTSSETITIEDKVWLPTSWELIGAQGGSPIAETQANQALFDPRYANGSTYATASRVKYLAGTAPGSRGEGQWYWLASPNYDTQQDNIYNFFRSVDVDGYAGHLYSLTTAGGVAPAFCVK